MWNKVWVPRKGCRVFFQQKTASFVKKSSLTTKSKWHIYKLSTQTIPFLCNSWHFAWGKRLEEVQCIPEKLQERVALWYCCRSAFSSAGWVTALWRHCGDSSGKDSGKRTTARFPGLTASGSSRPQNANNEVINRIIRLIPWKSHSSSSLRTVSSF